MVLTHPPSQPSQRRPHQRGYALGTRSGVALREPVEWLIDTGADIGYVNATVGNRFDSRVTGVSAHPLGGGAVTVVTGIEVELTVLDTASGIPQTRQTAGSQRYVAISSRAVGVDLIGMNQLADFHARLHWCALCRRGTLEA